MVIYVYERGSRFEDVMNEYMTTGKPIDPFEIVLELTEGRKKTNASFAIESIN